MAPVPSFAVSHRPEPIPGATITRAEAASRLKMAFGTFDKLIHAGILSFPIEATVVDELAARTQLDVPEGELTVVRLGPPRDDPDKGDSDWFHVTMTDQEVEDVSLRGQRCDPVRVLDNELLAVCVATIPVAVYAVNEIVGEPRRDKNGHKRYDFRGQLLARMMNEQVVRYDHHAPRGFDVLARQIMDSRIYSTSGGAVAYLGPHN